MLDNPKLICKLLVMNECVHSAKKLIIRRGCMAGKYDVNKAIELLFDDESGLSGTEK